MALPPVYNPAVSRLVARGYCESQEILNVTHWVKDSGTPWDTGAQNDLAAEYSDWWNLNVQAFTMATYVMSEIVVTQLAENGLQTIWTAGLPQSGSVTGDGLPLSIAACVTLSTGRAGRAGRGRQFIGCLGEGASSGSRFTPQFVIAVNTAFENLVSLPATGGLGNYDLVVYSTELNKTRRAVGLASPVTSAYLRDNIVDSQRRRLPGRGR